MDRKQKEKLRFFLKARKRSNQVLAERRDAERKKLERKQRTQANQTLVKSYTHELNELAIESGILTLAEQEARLRGGSLAHEVSCYVDYGISNGNFQREFAQEGQGKLKASHLAITITWEEAEEQMEAEIRVHKNGRITFHHHFLPIFPFLWRKYPRLLQTMLDQAIRHPRTRER